jgi:enterochelin esterase-like enzyme
MWKHKILDKSQDDFLVHENRELYNFLKKEELNVTYEEDEGTHDWQFWNRYIFKAFEWVEKVF